MKRVVVLLAAVMATPVALAAVIPASAGGAASGPSAAAVSEIPAALLPVYMAAATTCPGLPWQVLAAIGAIESNHAGGHADAGTGDVVPPMYGPPLDGSNGLALIRDASQPGGYARAVGPMQFLPTTWAQWGRLAPDRPPGATADPQNAWDAIYSAAAYLCDGEASITDLHAAVLRYNHSDAYLHAVLAKATQYGLGGPPLDLPGYSGDGELVVAAAMTQLGVPYVWGGSSPAVGFDCSGLVQWAYAQIGVNLPRTTGEQVLLGIPITTAQLHSGDLIFMDSNSGDTVIPFGHVAIYAGGGMQIAAPHTGDAVRVQPVQADDVRAVRRVLRSA